MRRRPAHVARILSLLLCAVILAVWARSYWLHDSWNWSTPSGRAGFDSYRGQFSGGQVVVTPDVMRRVPRGHIFTTSPADPAITGMPEASRSFAGFAVMYAKTPGMQAWDARVPYWFLALIAAMPSATHLYRRRRSRRRAGLCAGCGYDLRATPTRCPECGRRNEPRP